MASNLDSFDFGANSKAARQYPWDQWLDGQIWRLEAGDYTAKTPSIFAAITASVAHKRGLKLRHHVDKATGTITLQAYRPEPAPASEDAPEGTTEPTPSPSPSPAPVEPEGTKEPAPAPEAGEAPRRTRGRK